MKRGWLDFVVARLYVIIPPWSIHPAVRNREFDDIRNRVFVSHTKITAPCGVCAQPGMLAAQENPVSGDPLCGVNPLGQKLLVATHNQGKVREYRALLADLPLEVTYLDAEGVTFVVGRPGSHRTRSVAVVWRSRRVRRERRCRAWLA